MCERCEGILGKYATPHPTTPCPLEKALYCGICADYGHGSNTCKRSKYRNDEVVPDIATINIKYPDNFEKMIEISNEDATVRSALINLGITPMTCQAKGKASQRDFIENKRRLIVAMKELGHILVILEPEKRNGFKFKKRSKLSSRNIE